MSACDGRTALARAWLARAALAGAVLSVPACRREVTGGAGPAPSASVALGGLSPDLSARVLARVGGHAITLADYAAVLNAMDRFERLRYQTADRRKQLLDEMINLELLAREAERRGLGDKPETKELVRQILRDEVLRSLRDRQPSVESIPVGEVRAYYDAHRADFREPERRRVSHLVVKDRATAARLLDEARDATAAQWGELVAKHSLDKPGPDVPVELAGDLGLVTPPAAGQSDNGRVPEPVRGALFELDKVGSVLGRVVEAGGAFHLVRLTGKNPARDRSLEEADRTIRVRLAQERFVKAEAELEHELRGRFPVQVDEAALARVPVPAVGKSP
jgi:parvulin-like peptidyl-prolyl isomerase